MADPFPFLEIPDWVSSFSPCHTLDSLDRPLCGADMKGVRPPHSARACADEGHEVCETCRSLEGVER